MGVLGMVALITALLATSTVWLLLSEPAKLADAASTGRIGPLAQALGAAMYRLVAQIIAWL